MEGLGLTMASGGTKPILDFTGLRVSVIGNVAVD